MDEKDITILFLKLLKRYPSLDEINELLLFSSVIHVERYITSTVEFRKLTKSFVGEIQYDVSKQTLTVHDLPSDYMGMTLSNGTIGFVTSGDPNNPLKFPFISTKKGLLATVQGSRVNIGALEQPITQLTESFDYKTSQLIVSYDIVGLGLRVQKTFVPLKTHPYSLVQSIKIMNKTGSRIEVMLCHFIDKDDPNVDIECRIENNMVVGVGGTSIACGFVMDDDSKTSKIGIRKNRYRLLVEVSAYDTTTVHIVSSSWPSNEYYECAQITAGIIHEGIYNVLSRHERKWGDLWSRRISLDTNDEMIQKQLMLSMFYIHSMTNDSGNHETAPLVVGMYDQPYTVWMQDMWLIPVLMIFNPMTCRELLQQKMRHHTTELEIQILYVIHAWNYFRLNYDREWLSEIAYIFMKDVADIVVGMWVNNEWKGSDDQVTIYLIKQALKYTLHACYELKRTPFPKWKRVMDALAIYTYPYSKYSINHVWNVFGVGVVPNEDNNGKEWLLLRTLVLFHPYFTEQSDISNEMLEANIIHVLSKSSVSKWFIPMNEIMLATLRAVQARLRGNEHNCYGTHVTDVAKVMIWLNDFFYNQQIRPWSVVKHPEIPNKSTMMYTKYILSDCGCLWDLQSQATTDLMCHCLFLLLFVYGFGGLGIKGAVNGAHYRYEEYGFILSKATAMPSDWNSVTILGMQSSTYNRYSYVTYILNKVYDASFCLESTAPVPPMYQAYNVYPRIDDKNRIVLIGSVQGGTACSTYDSWAALVTSNNSTTPFDISSTNVVRLANGYRGIEPNNTVALFEKTIDGYPFSVIPGIYWIRVYSRDRATNQESNVFYPINQKIYFIRIQSLNIDYPQFATINDIVRLEWFTMFDSLLNDFHVMPTMMTNIEQVHDKKMWIHEYVVPQGTVSGPFLWQVQMGSQQINNEIETVTLVTSMPQMYANVVYLDSSSVIVDVSFDHHYVDISNVNITLKTNTVTSSMSITQQQHGHATFTPLERSTAYSIDVSANDILNNKIIKPLICGFQSQPYNFLSTRPGFEATAYSDIAISLPTSYAVNMWIKLVPTVSYTVIDSNDTFVKIMATGTQAFSPSRVIYARAHRINDNVMISFAVIRNPIGDPWVQEVILRFVEAPPPYSITFQGL